MPRPKRSDRRDNLPPFLRCFGDKPVQHSRAEIAPVQNDVDDKHQADNGVPCGDHGSAPSLPLATNSSSGPWPISRPTRKRNSKPSTKYNPVNPISVKIVLPLLTTLL